VIIDCNTCQVRGSACEDCVVSVLLGQPAGGALDDSERAAIAVLAGSGLVPPLRLVPGEAPSAARQSTDGHEIVKTRATG
jgi:hypothetical protein